MTASQRSQEQFASVDVSHPARRVTALRAEGAKRKHVSSRIPQLDGLRAIAMLSVFLYAGLGVPLLWMGVDLFFVLSGFLITGILLERKQTGTSYFRYFYSRRAKPILPPYCLLMVISSLLFGTAWLRHWYWFAFFLTNIPLAFHQLSHPSLGVLWSLAVEEQFYVIWPVVVLLTREALLSWVAWGLLLLAPILRVLATPHLATFAPIYNLTPFRMEFNSLQDGSTLCRGAHRNCLAKNT
jgi:peptidoglycan/LPS O-acetylase OafA/YrhL